MPTSHRFLLAAVVVSALAGCSGGESDGRAPTPAPATAPATVAPGQSPDPPAGTPTVPPSGAGMVTVTGQVAEGVEAGCRLLRAPGREYLLVVEGAADFALRVGDTVAVTGRVRPDLVTICAQGIPLVVSAVRPG